MAKHLVDLYRALLKDKGKRVEINFANGNGLDLSYFDMDFFLKVLVIISIA